MGFFSKCDYNSIVAFLTVGDIYQWLVLFGY